MRSRALGIASLLALALIAVPSVPSVAGDELEDAWAARIASYLDRQRAEDGVAALERRAALDEVARVRARRVADLPHSRRLALGESVEEGLRAAGVTDVRRSSVHTDMVRGYADPVDGFLRSWRSYAQAWERALDPRYDGLGIATARADDGWIILIAVFVQDLPPAANLEELERQTVEAVNAVRAEHGLDPLTIDPVLCGIARDHSDDMVRQGYFGHESPQGFSLDDRMRVRHVKFRRVGENLQRNRGWDDPVNQAVRSWLGSPGHRKSMLDPEYRETGVGVAVGRDGTYYFTQVFLLGIEPGSGPGIEP